MATKYARSAGNISGVTWYDAASGGNVVSAPVAGDAVVLNGNALTLDVAAWPASGAFASITDAGKSGYISVPLNTVGNCSISASTLTCGTSTNGLVQTTGTSTNTLTITGIVSAGSLSSTYGVYHNSTGTVNIVGNVYAGGGSSRYAVYVTAAGTLSITGSVNANLGPAVYLNAACTISVTGDVIASSSNHGIISFTTSPVTISVTGNVTGGGGTTWHGISIGHASSTLSVTGNVTGGTGTNACGINNTVNCAVTINGHMINGTGGMAYAGQRVPTWTNDGSKYQQWAITEGAVKLGREPSSANLLSGVICGDVTGAYQAPANADVKAGVANGVSPSVGTYNPASAPKPTFCSSVIMGCSNA